MKNVALITGVTGQDGSYLSEYLLKKGYEVHGIIRRSSVDYRERIAHLEGKPHFHLHYADMGDSMSLVKLVGKVQPTEIYNLAAQSHVQVSFDAPEFTADVDAVGVLRILEAVRTNHLEKTCKIYQASTSELYGKVDQPYVSQYHPGWAITISLEPTFEVRDRCGLSTSTRKMIQKIWPIKLPKMDPEMLARLVFCFENNPEREDGHVSGAQDSIGICVPGLCRHYYDNNFWPKRIESTTDEMTLRFLEAHLVMIPMQPRREGCSVVEGKDITREKVEALAQAADDCWEAIKQRNLEAFARAYKDSFNAQIAMFPAMVNPVINGQPCPEASVQPTIDHYSAMEEVLAWKMPGAGGGGYLALVVKDSEAFCELHPEAIPLTIRRQ